MLKLHQKKFLLENFYKKFKDHLNLLLSQINLKMKNLMIFFLLKHLLINLLLYLHQHNF